MSSRCLPRRGNPTSPVAQNSDEKAEIKLPAADTEEMLPMEKIPTPGTHTINLLAEFLHIPAAKTIKAVAFADENDRVILAFVRGDHEANETKIKNAVGALQLIMAEDTAICAVGGEPGFMSPIGINEEATVVVDSAVMNMKNAVTGANERDYHYKNVNPTRDFTNKNMIVTDIRMVQDGDPCPRCGEKMFMTRGIEAGQVFSLGTKYSEALGAKFLDEDGKEKPFQMGCYGIGVGRTMQAAIEQMNDEHGIIWPRAIAPFEVVVVPVNAKDEKQFAIAEKIYEELKAENIDVLFDDRPERAGVKFKDCDLIGYPLRVTVGNKAAETGEIEIKIRKSGEMKNLPADNYLTELKEILKGL